MAVKWWTEGGGHPANASFLRTTRSPTIPIQGDPIDTITSATSEGIDEGLQTHLAEVEAKPSNSIGTYCVHRSGG